MIDNDEKNVVYFELLRRGGEVFAGQTDSGEVDFVVTKANGTREYYQVAYTANSLCTESAKIPSAEISPAGGRFPAGDILFRLFMSMD